jgi:hypothetical protein
MFSLKNFRPKVSFITNKPRAQKRNYLRFKTIHVIIHNIMGAGGDAAG